MYVSFFVSLLARLWANGWTDLHETFREGVEWPRDDLITFLVNSEKPRDAAMRNTGTGFVVLSHHSLFLTVTRWRNWVRHIEEYYSSQHEIGRNRFRRSADGFMERDYCASIAATNTMQSSLTIAWISRYRTFMIDPAPDPRPNRFPSDDRRRNKNTSDSAMQMKKHVTAENKKSLVNAWWVRVHRPTTHGSLFPYRTNLDINPIKLLNGYLASVNANFYSV